MTKKFDDLTYNDMSGPRVMRARRFAHEIIALMRDFIPNDKETVRRIEDMLLRTAYETNAQIINVPPECDALDKMALERRMLEASMKQFILPNQPQPLESADASEKNSE